MAIVEKLYWIEHISILPKIYFLIPFSLHWNAKIVLFFMYQQILLSKMNFFDKLPSNIQKRSLNIKINKLRTNQGTYAVSQVSSKGIFQIVSVRILCQHLTFHQLFSQQLLCYTNVKPINYKRIIILYNMTQFTLHSTRKKKSYNNLSQVHF